MEPMLRHRSNNKKTRGEKIMSSMNHVFLMGNLTRDPECRSVQGGATVADLRLAMSDSYKDKEGNLVERTCFVDIAAWEKQAELCKQHLKKGSPILVEGRLQLDQWTTESGEKRSKLRVRATRVQFLGRAAGTAKPDAKTPETEMVEPIPF